LSIVKVTNVTPAELYFEQNLNLLLDLLQGSLPSNEYSKNVDEYI